MSYLRPNLAGVYDIPSINVSSQLYVRGKPFEQFINELVFEDQFEQEEITELKLLVQYLNTSGLSSEWIVDNNNKNQDLKTLITALQGKTQFTAEQLGAVANSYETFHRVLLGSSPAQGIRDITLQIAGGFEFVMQKDYGDPANNLYYLRNNGGVIQLFADEFIVESAVSMGTFGGSRDGNEYKIGGAMAKIRIGSEEDPIVGSGVPVPDINFNDTTEIHIGKRTALKNTKTYLNGNIHTGESRFVDLAVSDVVTWQQPASWFSGFVLTGGLPYWLAWIGLSGTPNYRYSDVMKMANNYLTGGLTKNGSIETSNDLAFKALSIINTDLVSLTTPFDGILNRRVFQAFAIHGSHSIGTIWGATDIYTGTGYINLRNDGGIFDWAFKNAGNANQLLIKNDDVELIQCNGTDAVTNKLILGACCGNIEMITATTGIRANATKVLEVKGNKQVKIGSNSDGVVDDTYKVLIDAETHANGIKLVKGNNTLLLNPTNVSSKSLTLQDNYEGSTTNTLYKNASNQLMWNGEKVGASPVGTSGGITYSIPVASNITNPAPTPTTIAMTTEYTSIPQRTINQAITTNSVFYIARFDTPVMDKAANPFISGIQQFNFYTTWNSNNTGRLTGKLHYRTSTANTMYSKTYAAGVLSTSGTLLGGTPILIPLGDYAITAPRSVWEGINITPTSGQTCVINGLLQVLIAGTWTTIVTTSSVVSTAVSLTNQTITINNTNNIASGTASPTHTAIRIALQATNGTITQNLSGGGTALGAYTIQGSSINASFRAMLYDGSAYPITTPNTATPVILEYDFACDPYEIADFNHSTLSIDMFFQQPSGGFNNHNVILYFNTGALSHFHSTINAPPSVGGGTTIINTTAADLDDVNTLVTVTSTISQPVPAYYGIFSLVPNMYEARLYTDMFMTPDGKFTWAVGNNLDNTLNGVMVAEGYGHAWGVGNEVDNFRSVAGKSDGTSVWALASGTDQANQLYNVIYRSDIVFNIASFDWTAQPAITLDNFNTAAQPQQIRMSADGKYQLITDYRANTNAKVYLSANTGVTWTTTNLTPNHITRCVGCAVNATGEIMFVCVDGISTGQGGIYRSQDFGATWTRVLTAPASPHLRVSCDATGRYVAVGRGTNVQTSRDYGTTWKVVNVANNLSVSVSPDGQYAWFGQLDGSLYYSSSFLVQILLVNDVRPSGNTYVNQAHDVIVTSNKGAVVLAAGIAGAMNIYRQPAQEVRRLQESPTIRVVADANTGGAYSLEIKSVSSGTNNVQRSVVEDQLAPVAGSGNTPPEDRLIAATTIIPRKASLYINSFQDVTGISQAGIHQDAYVSDTGRYLLSAMGTPNALTQFQLNLHRGFTDEAPWVLVGPTKFWKSVCGSSIGNRMYAVSVKNALGDIANSLYTSIDYGTTWTLLNDTPAAFKSNNTIGQIRCCGVGRNVFISSMTSGVVYRSTDFGVTWTTITVGTGSGTIPSIAVNSVGQYVFATVPTIGIFRSYDFGATFQQINSSTTAWLNISCSATAQFVVATRSGQTYAFSDDYGTSWTFGAVNYVDAAMSHAGNLVWFCYDGGVAFSDNNGLNIKETQVTNRTHQSIVMNTTGEYVFSPLNVGAGNNPLTIQARMLREPFTNVRNLSAGTNIVIDNDLKGGFTINANVPAPAVQFVSRMSWTGQTSQTLPVMDFINYDYEMIVEIQNVATNAWIYLYWNGGGSGTFIGDMIYPANVNTYQSGTDIQVPYWINNGSDTYFIQVGSSLISADNRSVINRYRLRGISSTRFALNIMGRQQLYWHNNNTITSRGMPSAGTYLSSSVWYNAANNANWAPTAITFNGQGASAPVTVTWLRINKVSAA
jgi:hypothetical protein